MRTHDSETLISTCLDLACLLADQRQRAETAEQDEESVRRANVDQAEALSKAKDEIREWQRLHQQAREDVTQAQARADELSRELAQLRMDHAEATKTAREALQRVVSLGNEADTLRHELESAKARLEDPQPPAAPLVCFDDDAEGVARCGGAKHTATTHVIAKVTCTACLAILNRPAPPAAPEVQIRTAIVARKPDAYTPPVPPRTSWTNAEIQEDLANLAMGRPAAGQEPRRHVWNKDGICAACGGRASLCVNSPCPKLPEVRP